MCDIGRGDQRTLNNEEQISFLHFPQFSQNQFAGKGDSGGPFICEENGLAMLQGILSGRWKYTNHHLAARNTFVFKHMEFIKMYMSANPDPCC